MSSNHITCDNCGNQTVSREIKDTVRIRRAVVTVDRMPVEQCPNCGAIYYDGPYMATLSAAVREQAAA